MKQPALIIVALGAFGCFRLNGFSYGGGSTGSSSGGSTGAGSSGGSVTISHVTGDGTAGVIDNALVISGSGFGSGPIVTLTPAGASAIALIATAGSDSQITATLPSSIGTTVPSATPIVFELVVANGATKSASFALSLARGASGAAGVLASPLAAGVSASLVLGNDGTGPSLQVSKGSIDFSSASAVHYPKNAVTIRRSTATNGAGNTTGAACDAGEVVLAGDAPSSRAMAKMRQPIHPISPCPARPTTRRRTARPRVTARQPVGFAASTAR